MRAASVDGVSVTGALTSKWHARSDNSMPSPVSEGAAMRLNLRSHCLTMTPSPVLRPRLDRYGFIGNDRRRHWILDHVRVEVSTDRTDLQPPAIGRRDLHRLP